MFTARGLTAAEAHLAYPLVSCRYPTLSLQLWTNYVREAERDDAQEHLICLVDQRDRRHAVFAWGVDRSKQAGRLRVAHIATFQLVGDAIHRALHRTVDMLASEHDCREVVIETWMGCDNVTAVPRTGAHPNAGGVLNLDTTIERTGALN